MHATYKGLNGAAASDLPDGHCLVEALWLRAHRSQKVNVPWMELDYLDLKSNLGTTDEWRARLHEQHNPLVIFHTIQTTSGQMQRRIMFARFQVNKAADRTLMSHAALCSGKALHNFCDFQKLRDENLAEKQTWITDTQESTRKNSRHVVVVQNRLPLEWEAPWKKERAKEKKKERKEERKRPWADNYRKYRNCLENAVMEQIFSDILLLER